MDDSLKRFIPKRDLNSQAPERQLGVGILECIIDEVRGLSKTWSQLTKKQQDKEISKVRARVYELAEDVTKTIAAERRVSCQVDVESMTTKKGQTKATLICKTGKHDVLDWVGRGALLVFTDIESVTDGIDAVEGDDDQGSLALDTGPDSPSASDIAKRLLKVSGIDISADHKLWSTISPGDMSRVLEYVEQLEAGNLKAPVPGILGPFLPPEEGESS